MKTIVLITNIPTPYRIPLFNLLAESMSAHGWELHVIFSSKTYKRRKFEINESEFKFKYTILQGGKWSVGEDAEKTYFFYRGLWKILKQIKPWRIISSGFSPATTLAAIWKFFYGTPFIIWSGTIELGERKTSWWRRQFRKLLLHRASSFITYGSLAADYLEKLGAKKERIHIALNTVDTTFFRTSTDVERRKIKEAEAFTFLYLGYLVPRKNVHKVLEAACLLHKKRGDFRITIIGDGISRPDLEKEVSAKNLDTIITFTGYKQKEELPPYLAQADALLFQTDFDIWGLVLNEAMAAGVPCLASTHAGASFDLIKDDINGYLIDFTDIQKTADKMEWMIANREKVKVAGQRASEFIFENAGLSHSVSGFIQAIKNLN